MKYTDAETFYAEASKVLDEYQKQWDGDPNKSNLPKRLGMPAITDLYVCDKLGMSIDEFLSYRESFKNEFGVIVTRICNMLTNYCATNKNTSEKVLFSVQKRLSVDSESAVDTQINVLLGGIPPTHDKDSYGALVAAALAEEAAKK